MNLSNLRTNKKTNTILVLTSILLFVSLFTYLYFFWVIKRSNENISLLQKEVIRLEIQESEIDKLKKNLASTKENQEKLSSYFIDINNPVPFFEVVEGYGRGAGVKTVFNDVTLKKDPYRLDAGLTATGSFSGIYRFLQILESAPYEFSITKLNLQRVVPLGLEQLGAKPSLPEWEARILISVVSITKSK